MYAFAAGAGRIIAGMLSDGIGRLWIMCVIFLFQAGLMMALRTGLTDSHPAVSKPAASPGIHK